MLRARLVLVAALLLGFVLVGCSSDGAAPPSSDGDMENEQESLDGDTDADGDAEPDGDAEADGEADMETEMDADGDAEADAETLAVPFEPDPVGDPYIDTPFLQEFNHTLNELEPGIGALVAVRLAPPDLDGYETPVQVTPRGVVTHDGTGALRIADIDPGHADLIDAAFFNGKLLLAGPEHLYSFTPETGLTLFADAPQGTTITGLAVHGGDAFVLSSSGLTLIAQPLQWVTDGTAATAFAANDNYLFVAHGETLAVHTLTDAQNLGAPLYTVSADDGLSKGSIRAMVADVALPQAIDLVLVCDNGLIGLDISESGARVMDVALFAAGRVPYGDPKAAAPVADGGFVVATGGGAYRMLERDIGPEWRVYNRYRWLPEADVRAVATDASLPDAPIYFATSGGLGFVHMERITLEEKIERFIERVLLRHDRDGAVADSRMSTPGDLSTSIPYDSDNDGGWTCYWVLAECFRYKETGDEAAKAHFDKSLDRMLSFQTLTGTDWFLARSVIRKDGCVLDDCDGPDDGEWFTSPDGEWWVKGDTSNDEVTSHMFMMGHAYDLCADEDQRARIRQHVDKIIGGIVDHGYRLLDIDEKVTTHGQFDPEYVNNPLAGGIADGGRRSVQMIANLTIAHYMTGDARYLDAKQYLMQEHHYDENIVHESEYPLRSGSRSGDGDELATQAFFPLLRYERDPVLRAKWLEGWRNTYSNMKLQQAAMWDFINVVVGGEPDSFFNAARWLKLVPMDLIRWRMHNTNRLDLIEPPEYYRADNRMQRSDGLILPGDERPNIRHNTSQYELEGGWGRALELDGADVVMPYWMARYYGMIVGQ